MKKEDYKQWKSKLIPLPCPLCGKWPMVGPKDPKKEGDAYGYVRCTNKRCYVMPKVGDGTLVADMRGPGAYRDAAIRRWNKRA